MRAKDAIHSPTPALTTTSTVEEALGMLMEHRVRHLPVVDEDDALVGVFPCRLDGETHTPCDAIARLASTAESRVLRSADTA